MGMSKKELDDRIAETKARAEAMTPHQLVEELLNETWSLGRWRLHTHSHTSDCVEWVQYSSYIYKQELEKRLMQTETEKLGGPFPANPDIRSGPQDEWHH